MCRECEFHHWLKSSSLNTHMSILSRFPRFFRPSSPIVRSQKISRMAQNNLDASRAKLFQDMKIDILTETQEDENIKARHEVSRSFVCKYFASLVNLALTTSLADTITGKSLDELFCEYRMLITHSSNARDACICPQSVFRGRCILRAIDTRPPGACGTSYWQRSWTLHGLRNHVESDCITHSFNTTTLQCNL